VEVSRRRARQQLGRRGEKGDPEMATCSSCGEPLRDGAWTCGYCGAPIGRESGSTDLYGAPPTTTAVAVAQPAGVGQLTKLVLVAGLIIIIAIAGLWFFWLRGNTASGPFAGTWKGTTSASKFVIKSSGGGYELTAYDASGKKGKAIPLTAAGDTLELNLTPTASDPNQQAAADYVNSMVGSITGVSGFKYVFTPGSSPGRLVLTFGGTATNATGQKLLAMREEFKRD
jgi:hypothetical protein